MYEVVKVRSGQECREVESVVQRCEWYGAAIEALRHAMESREGEFDLVSDGRWVTWTLKDHGPRIYNFAQYWDDYMGDVERNLEMFAEHEPKALEHFRKWPGPTAVDVLGDFGTFPEGMPDEAVTALIQELVLGHYGADALCDEAYDRPEEECPVTKVVLVPYWEVHLPLGEGHVVALRTENLGEALDRAVLLQGQGAKLWSVINGRGYYEDLADEGWKPALEARIQGDM
jgi:hypothetical protein